MYVKAVFFCYSIREKQPPLKKKSNWILPPSDSNTFISFFTHVEQELVSINIPRRKTYSKPNTERKGSTEQPQK